MTDDELDKLVMSLASAIKEPPGSEELRISQAMIALLRKSPARYRMYLALETEMLLARFHQLESDLSKAFNHE